MWVARLFNLKGNDTSMGHRFQQNSESMRAQSGRFLQGNLVEQPSFRNHYEIPWFKWNVALEVFSRQEIAIVENKYLVLAGHVPMNLYPALGRKLTKPTRQSYGLHDARARADRVRPWAVHLSCNVNSRRRAAAYCTGSGLSQRHSDLGRRKVIFTEPFC